MSATYSASLPTDLDWVRFLIADINVVTPQLQDEEILAVIAEESGGVAAAAALKYVAAARLLSMLQSKWATAGGGLISKTVSRLSKTWGISGVGAEVLEYRIKYLLECAANLCLTQPRFFKTLGRSASRGF